MKLQLIVFTVLLACNAQTQEKVRIYGHYVGESAHVHGPIGPVVHYGPIPSTNYKAYGPTVNYIDGKIDTEALLNPCQQTPGVPRGWNGSLFGCCSLSDEGNQLFSDNTKFKLAFEGEEEEDVTVSDICGGAECPVVDGTSTGDFPPDAKTDAAFLKQQRVRALILRIQRNRRAGCCDTCNLVVRHRPDPWTFVCGQPRQG